MSKSSNQKLKLLYIYDLLLHTTDEEHPVSTQDIIDHLSSYGISAERKSIYADIEALRVYGLDIIKSVGRNSGYYIASRPFELPELKLLVDTVQSSRFITHKKSMSLIKKIEGLCSEHQARDLQRQVFVANRIKTMNESIYYNVDEIHSGISENKQIAFKYYEYAVSKERVPRKNGEDYIVSPIALTWDDQNYYMIAYDEKAGRVKHYRVDKMGNIRTTASPRHPDALLSSADMAEYSNKVFGMFTGTEKKVQMRFSNFLVGAVIDRFGTGINIVPDGESHFIVTTEVVLSPQFLAWLFGFGTDAAIISPEDVKEKMKTMLAETMAQYE